jgi:hypothetical protein
MLLLQHDDVRGKAFSTRIIAEYCNKIQKENELENVQYQEDKAALPEIPEIRAI